VIGLAIPIALFKGETKQLKEAGALTDAEFQLAKARLLS
jgi:hypothetical protein